MTQNPTSHRKATSSFISDSSNLNPVQVSPRGHKPHSEQRSPFTMANKNSKTNFITDSFLFEGPRAVAVSETGEKHFIEVDDEEFSKSCSNPFTLSSNISTTNHHVSMSSMPKILERSSHSEMEKSIKQQNDISESNCKVVKKSKNHRSRVHQRNRLQFTPRNAERTSSASLILKTVKTQSTQPTISKINKNTETQTETPRFSSISVATPIYNGTNMERRMQMSIVKPPLLNESINRPQIFVPTLQQAPLKIYTKSNSDLDIYSELRSIISMLTLLTVVSWLFVTFFELETLTEYFEIFIANVQNWFSTKEKPKTKVELLLQFLTDLWASLTADLF